ncbi:MAG: sugar ABC transporter substrate-binding protein [Anaerolineae bacterium]|jgi:multiple sugar transport system substrate-binding protein|nr:sugar ABC transporter substrate-binding protein [Anaerolineae bacterium]
MHKSKKWFILLATMVVLALLVAACATPAEDSEPADDMSEEEQGTIILRVGTGDSGEGLNNHQEIIQRFEAENPDILVQLEAVAGNDYYTRLLTQVSANDAPDIMQIGDDAVPMFVDAGALISLDEFIANDADFDTSIYLPGLLEPGQYMGQQYMLPKDFSPMGVYFNKSIFDEYGVDYPTDDWTWTEFLDIAQQLTMDTDGDGKTDIWGVQLTANWTTGFEYFIFANGGKLISEDGKNFVGVMDSEASIGAVQFFSDLYNVYKVAPPPADFNAWAGGNSEFDNGQAAMRLFGRWPQDGYLNNPNIDLGTVQPPAGVEKANILFWGGFGISSTSENPEAAWRFLKFYAGLEGSEVWVERAIPPVASVAEEAGLAQDPIESTWIKGLDHLVDRTYVFTPYWGATGDAALRTVLETVLTDPDADITQLMKDAAVQAQTALDEKLAEE